MTDAPRLLPLLIRWPDYRVAQTQPSQKQSGKMRFLCLHGAGTNSKIFEKQTALLRRELGSGHEYDFVEGTRETSMAPEIRNVAVDDSAYFQYYAPYFRPDSFVKAVADLRQYIVDEGPYDGLMAFSQGTSVAAAYLVEERLADAGRALPVRCAIFLCGRPPYLDAGTQPAGFVDLLPVARGSGDEDGNDGPGLRPALLPATTIDLPTVHVWGADDQKEPGQSEKLYRICAEHSRSRVVHPGGHEVPGGRMSEALYESALAIRKLISRLERDRIGGAVG